MPATVLLEHTLPDGSAHFDWLIARAETVGDDDRALVAFRVRERLDRLPSRTITAERLPDHRGLYLRHEGPISGGRGAVRRVAEGTARILAESPGGFVARVEWTGRQAIVVQGAPVCGPGGAADAWLLEVEPG